MPNDFLKRERELRGWSQQYVTEHIQAPSPSYVSRWERGITSPGPYYREKLCTLFAKNAYELGFFRDFDKSIHRQFSATGDHQIQNDVVFSPQTARPVLSPPKTISHSTQDIERLAPLFLTNTKATDLIGRMHEIHLLLDRLSQSKSGESLAIYGLPGVGKTSLATALIQEEELQCIFHHGVLWVTVGVNPNIPELLARWARTLGISSHQRNTPSGQTTWIQALQEAIGLRKMLIVIDDVWRPEDALAFKIGGPHCVYLFITRLPGLAHHLADSTVMAVHELDSQQSLALLARFIPGIVQQEPDMAQSLTQLVGGHTLALTLIGKYLRLQAHSGQPRRIQEAIELLRHTERRFNVAEPRALLEHPVNLPKYMPVSLQAVIEISDQQLEKEACQALYALSVLPSKPHDFSEEAALAVANTRPAILDQLTDAGLLEGNGPARYMLHQTLTDYACLKLQNSLPQENLITYVARYVQQYSQDQTWLKADLPTILTGLRLAFVHKKKAELVQIVNALTPFFQPRGLDLLVEEHFQQAYQSAMASKNISDRTGAG